MAKSTKALPKQPEVDLEQELGVYAPSSSQLTDIAKQVNKAMKIKSQIDELEKVMTGMKNELHLLVTRDIPDAMAAAGTMHFKTDDGLSVTVRDFVSGSLPKEEKNPAGRKWAMNWLMKNDGASLIKTQFSVALGKGQGEMADIVKKALLKTKVTFVEKEDVHPQTLAAFIREKMKDGKKVPLEKLGLYAGRAARIEEPDKS